MIGYKFFEHKGFLFREHMGAIIPLSFPDEITRFNKKEAKVILASSPAHFIRWEDKFDSPKENNWWNVIRDEKVDLNEYSSKTRNQVRRGLRNFNVLRIEKNEILEKGYPIYREVFRSYNTVEKELDHGQFTQAINSLPTNTEFYGLYDIIKNEFVGFSENYVSCKAVFYVSIWIKPLALRNYANYALLYKMTEDYLNNRSFRYVSDGARSISHDTRIHDFLIKKLKFRKAYSRLNIIYSPLLSLLVNALMPFRSILSKINFNKSARKLNILLFQENLKRSQSI